MNTYFNTPPITWLYERGEHALTTWG